MDKRLIELRPCCLCVRIGYGESPAEFHHIREGRQGVRGKKGIPLCPPHHRIGPDAIHVMGKRAWERRYGVTELQLWEELESK